MLRIGSKLKAKMSAGNVITAGKIYEVVRFDHTRGNPVIRWNDGIEVSTPIDWFEPSKTVTGYSVIRRFNIGGQDEHEQPWGCMYGSREDAERQMMKERGDVAVAEVTYEIED